MNTQYDITCKCFAYAVIRDYCTAHPIDLDIDDLRNQLLTGNYDSELHELVARGRKFTSAACDDDSVIDYYFKYLYIFANSLPDLISHREYYDKKFLKVPDLDIFDGYSSSTICKEYRHKYYLAHKDEIIARQREKRRLKRLGKV